MEEKGHERHLPQIGAVFADRDRAAAAVEALRESGLADEHLGVAVHSDTYVFEHAGETEVKHGIGRGIALGAPVGAVAGMTVLALVAPGIAAVGLGGILAAGAATGALAGGFWGAYLGLTREEQVLEDEWDWERTPLGTGEVLVVVCQHADRDTVEKMLERHGGRVVVKPPHVD